MPPRTLARVATTVALGAGLVLAPAVSATAAPSVPPTSTPTATATATAPTPTTITSWERRGTQVVLHLHGAPGARVDVDSAAASDVTHLDGDGTGTARLRLGAAFSWQVELRSTVDGVTTTSDGVVGSGPRAGHGLVASSTTRDWFGRVQIALAGHDGAAWVTDEHGNDVGFDLVRANGEQAIQTDALAPSVHRVVVTTDDGRSVDVVVR